MRSAKRAARVAFFCHGERAPAIKGDETVQPRIESIDALKRALNKA